MVFYGKIVVVIYQLICGKNMDNYTNKKELSEEDIKNRYITPALNGAGWNNDEFRMELKVKAQFTDGKISFDAADTMNFLKLIGSLASCCCVKCILLVEIKNALNVCSQKQRQQKYTGA